MLGRVFYRNVADAIFLNQPTEPLPDLMGSRLDLIVMRNPSPLLQFLQATRHLRSSLQKFGQLRLHRHLFRVHANLPRCSPSYHTATTLTHFQHFPLLTFSLPNRTRNS